MNEFERRYKEKENLEKDFKDFLFEFIELTRMMTKTEIHESLKDKILRTRNYAKKLADELDELYVEELKN